jgi:hypothetical protein
MLLDEPADGAGGEHHHTDRDDDRRDHDRHLVDEADRGEPIGLLSHHLVHDEATWFFFEALLERIARLGLSFTDAERLFSGDSRIAVGV